MGIRVHFNKFKKLSWKQRSIFFVSLLLFPVNSAGIRLFGFKRWSSFLTVLSPLSQNSGVSKRTELVTAAGIARMVLAAARYGPYRPNCLQQSLSLLWILRRNGIVADLKIGMKKESGRVEGHAWIELEGIVLNDAPDVKSRFAPLENFETTFWNELDG